MSRSWKISIFLLFEIFIQKQFSTVHASCSSFNYCSGHGKCQLNGKCKCYEGWGSENDITSYRAPDCSARTCPSHVSWADIPILGVAHDTVEECSGKGVCDRKTGMCKCSIGYEGPACERYACPNKCSGHGRCVSMRRLADKRSATPYGNATTYENDLKPFTEATNITAWDSDMIYGCLCDSSWLVGYRPGETQEAEFFGADCSLKHCPTGDDPVTDEDETDCEGVSLPNSNITGQIGNLCHVDCSNRGLCDYQTGECHCFNGHYGANCQAQIAEKTYPYSPLGIHDALAREGMEESESEYDFGTYDEF